MRIRSIFFKDYGDENPGVWDTDPMVVSNFFSLPAEEPDFKSFVAPQVADGGGDWAESGLECLNEAMSSQWTKVGDKPSGFTDRVTDVYPLIVMWTDASSHYIGYPNSLANPDYPAASKMPRTYPAFLAKWNSESVIDQAHKQILFFGDPGQDSYAADGSPSGYHEIMKWPNFVHGGTEWEANAEMVSFLAGGIARSVKGLRLTN